MIEKRLKELRLYAGLTQKAVAEEVGISSNGYANWEQGKSEPDIECIIRLCSVFQITADELLGMDVHDSIVKLKPKSDIEELFNKLSPSSKNMALGYIQALVDKEK
ncbi:MAG: helix-turn-helix domain-containing protein [Clostridiaceae bacterium]|jgi:transcriptional regulator with XRE-family HTH domain|nr:helix-turn-helix domain-containing protein [Clostridiaceae bacterium]